MEWVATSKLPAAECGDGQVVVASTEPAVASIAEHCCGRGAATSVWYIAAHERLAGECGCGQATATMSSKARNGNLGLTEETSHNKIRRKKST
jgi:hypothetical protein